MEYIEENLNKCYKGDLLNDYDANSAFQAMEASGKSASAPAGQQFAFDTYTNRIVVSSYKYHYSQLLEKQKQLSMQMSVLVRSYINGFPKPQQRQG